MMYLCQYLIKNKLGLERQVKNVMCSTKLKLKVENLVYIVSSDGEAEEDGLIHK